MKEYNLLQLITIEVRNLNYKEVEYVANGSTHVMTLHFNGNITYNEYFDELKSAEIRKEEIKKITGITNWI